MTDWPIREDEQKRRQRDEEERRHRMELRQRSKVEEADRRKVGRWDRDCKGFSKTPLISLILSLDSYNWRKFNVNKWPGWGAQEAGEGEHGRAEGGAGQPQQELGQHRCRGEGMVLRWHNEIASHFCVKNDLRDKPRLRFLFGPGVSFLNKRNEKIKTFNVQVETSWCEFMWNLSKILNCWCFPLSQRVNRASLMLSSLDKIQFILTRD